jgi:hypothetical protein
MVRYAHLGKAIALKWNSGSYERANIDLKCARTDMKVFYVDQNSYLKTLRPVGLLH